MTIRIPDFRKFSWLWLPLLFVLFARVAVAPGWMMDADSGVLTVRICSDVNAVGKSVDIPFERDSHQMADQQHCPWGALAEAVPVPVAPDFAGVSVTPIGQMAAAPQEGFAPGAASPLPPSTGPPAFI